MQRQLFALLLLVSLSFSISIDLSSLVDSSGQTYSNLQIKTNSSTPYSFSVNGEVSSIKVIDRSGLILDHTSNYQNGRTTIYVVVPSDYLEVDFVSNSFTSKNSSYWSYLMDFGSNQNISSFSAVLLLPANSTIFSSNGAISQKGNSLFVFWGASNISSNTRILMRSSYESSLIIDNSVKFDYSSILIFIVILFAILLFFFSKKQSKPVVLESKPEQKNQEILPAQTLSIEENSVFKTLDEVDKQIVNYIQSKGRQTTQADLNLNTHIPKATLSRRVASLESRGILQKSQKGIRNLITLSDLIK